MQLVGITEIILCLYLILDQNVSQFHPHLLKTINLDYRTSLQKVDVFRQLSPRQLSFPHPLPEWVFPLTLRLLS